jgi:hypothetical protein
VGQNNLISRGFSLMTAKFARLNQRIDALTATLNSFIQIVQPSQLDKGLEMLFRSVPSHLLRTYFALRDIGEGQAEDVAHRTGRSRPLESTYLKQLFRMGLVGARQEKSLGMGKGANRIIYFAHPKKVDEKPREAVSHA